jgi:hypothetical protein
MIFSKLEAAIGKPTQSLGMWHAIVSMQELHRHGQHTKVCFSTICGDELEEAECWKRFALCRQSTLVWHPHMCSRAFHREQAGRSGRCSRAVL